MAMTKDFGTKITQKAASLLADPKYYSDSMSAIERFNSGEMMFLVDNLSTAYTLANSSVDWGVLPLPKYDTAQEKYITSPDSFFTMFGLPVTIPSEDMDLVGVIMEALNAESWKTVYPAYYEYALKGRYSSDENMTRMIELIADSRIYEYAPLCGQSLNNAKLHTLMCVCIDENNTDLASLLAENDHSIKRTLAEILAFFDVEDETGILGADYELPDNKFGT